MKKNMQKHHGNDNLLTKQELFCAKQQCIATLYTKYIEQVYSRKDKKHQKIIECIVRIRFKMLLVRKNCISVYI